MRNTLFKNCSTSDIFERLLFELVPFINILKTKFERFVQAVLEWFELKIKISFRVAINSKGCLSSNKEWTVNNKTPSSSLANCLHFTSRPSYFYCLHYPAKLPRHIKSQTGDGQHNARVLESRELSEQGDLVFNISVNSCQKSSVTFRLIENAVQRLLRD